MRMIGFPEPVRQRQAGEGLQLGHKLSPAARKRCVRPANLLQRLNYQEHLKASMWFFHRPCQRFLAAAWFDGVPIDDLGPSAPPSRETQCLKPRHNPRSLWAWAS